jgi:hypothetical protein
VGGGILGRPVEVIYEDDKTDPLVAMDATRKLIERDGVLAVVGPITSRNLNAIAPMMESMKTPLLYATNYEGGKCSRYIFSFSTVPNQELAQLLPYMNRTFGNTYFLLGADRVWPHKMFEATEPIISNLGGHVVGKEVTGTETDFAPRDRTDRLDESKGSAVRAEGHRRRVSRIVRDRPGRVRWQGSEHVRCGAVRRDERRAVGQSVCCQGQGRKRRRYRDFELCDDALQRADRHEGGDRTGWKGRQRIDDRCPRRSGDQITHRDRDDRQESSRGHEHVHGQDEGTRPHHCTRARRDRTGA